MMNWNSKPLKYNRRAKQPDKIMLQEVVTTLAGFMNSRKGGLLVVGYDEDLDEVNGIEEDYPHTGKKKFDSWRGILMSSFSDHCKKEFEVFIESITTVKHEGKTLAKVVVKHSDKPVFYDDGFYRRSHGKTQKLTGLDMHNYINRMWPEHK
ncbi:MAG: putative DNA binding domain-containing protein [Nitrosopumilus sp.]|nr:putative DNA binding domain-containing protein [Nitrosopumilus sp.]MDH3486552.1 putative DNA binding domain-containing protein [Nitrosopumilus sp.]